MSHRASLQESVNVNLPTLEGTRDNEGLLQNPQCRPKRTEQGVLAGQKPCYEPIPRPNFGLGSAQRKHQGYASSYKISSRESLPNYPATRTSFSISLFLNTPFRRSSDSRLSPYPGEEEKEPKPREKVVEWSRDW